MSIKKESLFGRVEITDEGVNWTSTACPSCARIADTEGLAQVILRCSNNGVLDIVWLTNNKVPWHIDIALAVQKFLRGGG